MVRVAPIKVAISPPHAALTTGKSVTSIASRSNDEGAVTGQRYPSTMAYSVALGCHDRQISDEVSANMQGAVLVDDRVGRDRAADNRGAIDDECPFTAGVMIGTYNGRPHCQRPLQHRWTVSGSVESDHRPDCLFEHDLERKPVSTFRDHAPVLKDRMLLAIASRVDHTSFAPA